MQLQDVLLALLDRPASGWDLSARLEATLPRLMSVPPSQIYPVLHRLEAAGLVSSQEEPSRQGPPRRVHRLTAAGRDRLQAALATPARGRDRRPDLVQLSLLDLADARDAGALLRTTLSAWQADLASTRHALEALGEAPPAGSPDPRRHARLGLTLRQAELAARIAVLSDALEEDADQAPR